MDCWIIAARICASDIGAAIAGAKSAVTRNIAAAETLISLFNSALQSSAVSSRCDLLGV